MIIFFGIFLTLSYNSYGVLRTWNGTVGNFSDAARWSGGVVPTTADSVEISAGTVTLTANTTIRSLRFSGGTLALADLTLNVTFYTYISAGSITENTATTGTTGTLNCTGTSFEIIGGTHSARFAVTCLDINNIKNTIFNGPVSFTKTGTLKVDQCDGGNTFNETASFATNAGTIDFQYATGDIFEKDVSYSVTTNVRMHLSYRGATTYKGNLTLSNTGGNEIVFGENNTASGGTTSITNGTISLGTFNENNSSIQFTKITKTSLTNMALVGTNNVYINFKNNNIAGDVTVSTYQGNYSNNTFKGNVTVTETETAGGPAIDFNTNVCEQSVTLLFPSSYIYNNSFNTISGTTSLTKNGPFFDFNHGGNTFNGITTITNAGTSPMIWGSGGTTGDIFNKDVTFNNSGTSELCPSHTGTSYYRGNIYIKSTSSNITKFSNDDITSTSKSIIEGTGSIIVSAATFTAGRLSLTNIIQTSTGANDIRVPNRTVFIRNCDLAGTLNLIGNSNAGACMSIRDNTICRANVTIDMTGPPADWQANGVNIHIANSTLQQSLTLVASDFSLQNSNFGTLGGTTSVTKVSGSNSSSWKNGGNTFARTTTFTNNALENIELANDGSGDTYYDVNFVQNTTAAIEASKTYASLYKGNINLTNTSTGRIRFGDGGGTSTLDNNKSINTLTSYTGSLRILLFTQANVAPITNAPHVLTLTGTSGSLYITNSTFQGNVDMSVGNIVQISNSVFHRNTTLVAPSISQLSANTFNSTNTTTGTCQITKTGSEYNTVNGGNTFRGTTTILNSSTGFLRFANSNSDNFQHTLILTNTGTSSIALAYAGTNTFANIFVNSSAGNGIYFCEAGGSGTATIASGNSINNGNLAFSAGTLSLRNVTQAGSIANVFNTTSTGNLEIQTSTLGGDWTSNIANVATITSSTFQRNIALTASSLTMTGSTTNTVAATTTLITKTGTSDNTSNGGNAFNGVTAITNNGTGSFGWGATNPEIFATNATFTSNNTGTLSIPTSSTGTTFGGTTTFNKNAGFTGTINIVRNSSSATFNGPAIINNNAAAGMILVCETGGSAAIFNGSTTFNNSSTTGQIRTCQSANTTAAFNGAMSFSNTSSEGIYFGNLGTGGATTLSDGAGRSLSASSFATGKLILTNFTQIGTTSSQAMTLTGNAALTLGPSITFNAAVNFTSPQLFLTGGIYNNTASLTKNGATDNSSTGGNTFNSTTAITNDGTGYLRLAGTTADNFIGNVTFAGAGTGTLQVAYNGQNNFEGHVTCNRSLLWNGGTGVAYFRNGNIQNLGGSVTPIVIPRLTVDKSSNYVNLTSPITVSNTLTLTTNYVDLNGQTLTISNASGTAIVKAAGWVRSERKDNTSQITWQIGSITGDHIFPFGKNTTDRNLHFNFNLTAGNAGDVTLSTYATVSDNSINRPITPETVESSSFISSTDNIENIVDRFWQITKSGASGTATVTFTYADDERPTSGDRETGLKAFRYNTGLDKWTKDIPNQSQNIAANTVTVANLTTFSPWTLIMPSSPLPLQFLSLSIDALDTKAMLHWKTAHELHTSVYFIERSIDGINFAEIGSLNPANSNEENMYDFTDSTPLNGTGYYRIKAVGVNGEIVYSYLQDVTFDGIHESIALYPNPTEANNINLLVNQKENHDVNVSIFNTIGMEVYKNTFTSQGGSSINTLNVENELPTGAYMVVVRTAHDTFRKNIIIK